ncbi:mediator of RNA polymerase II transcription subunit 12-like protein [Antedon mediterranea]|uniref:mediator of RNA polymerase II transcription subunit 12-like protein n=1 Tax=Antedon mediterranea TaxID=105859 RepID=UPI003AF751D0
MVAVLPWNKSITSDELTTSNVKQGFTNQPSFSDETGTARNSHINHAKFGTYFSGIVAEKQKLNTLQDGGRRKVLVSRENVWNVTQRNTSSMHTWFQDLAGIRPLAILAKKVPLFHRKEEIFRMLAEHQVPMIRATWLLKMTHASTQAITDSKVRPKRAQSDPSIEWCQVITRFLKEILSKIADPHQTPSGPNPVSTLQTPTITDSDTAHKMWDYMTTLARYLYEECMLDCHEYLSWLVETVEKVNPKDDNILRLVLPIVMQVSDYKKKMTHPIQNNK